MKKVWYILALLALFMVVITYPKMDKVTSQEVKVTPEQSLPTVGTLEKLRSILTEAESSRTLMGQGRGFGGGGDVMLGVATKSAQSSAAPAPASSSHDLGVSSDYSTTNLQVDSVDEADIIKNDAVFDVTDVTHPVEMFKTIIGDRGTDSEVLRNHKALLFDKEKGILSFPVTLMEIKNPSVTNSGKGIPQYGQFTYQGAYVYQFDLLKGFTLRGKITHLKDVDLLKAGQNYKNDSKAIQRIIFIKDTLYTISKGMIKANDLSSLHEKNSLILNP